MIKLGKLLTYGFLLLLFISNLYLLISVYMINHEGLDTQVFNLSQTFNETKINLEKLATPRVIRATRLYHNNEYRQTLNIYLWRLPNLKFIYFENIPIKNMIITQYFNLSFDDLFLLPEKIETDRYLFLLDRTYYAANYGEIYIKYDISSEK